MTNKVIARRNPKNTQRTKYAYFCPTTEHHALTPRPVLEVFEAVTEGKDLPENAVCSWCKRGLPLDEGR